MYEFHGWFRISDNAVESDASSLSVAVEKVKSTIDAFDWSSGVANLRALNGEYFLTLTGLFNRRLDYDDDIGKLLTVFSENARGTYGLLYWRDDEDESPPGSNNFHVYVVAKGVRSHRFDPFLSPAVPVIEE